jgi:hypothetical protein
MSLGEGGNMARAVLVVSRRANQPNRLDGYRDVLNRKLTGDNISPKAVLHSGRTGIAAALLNASGAARMSGASIAVGTLLDAGDDWHVPGATLPDGNFALLRVDDAFVELAADAVGSRTLWYALTEQELLASTSQRALVTLLGSFEPNRNALPWMLSSGTLGPTDGWDARLKRVQPGERVVLDRSRWRLSATTATSDFAPYPGLSHATHLERLRAAVAEACRRWSFDPRRWVLTLSGGADSRALLWLLRDRGIDSITWGLPGSVEQDGNDAQIARLLARSLRVPHRFFEMAPAAVAPELVLERFVAAGEGRVDRLSGYVDGFRVWKTLFDEGREGVIRGDEAFGSVPVSTAAAARYATSLTTLDDFFGRDELKTFDLPEQRLPPHLLRGNRETLAAWRDRLYQQFRVPTLLAGLTDLKTAYLEVGNPLLSRSVVDCARTRPDDLRTDRRLWRELVSSQVPNLGLATQVAIPSLLDFLADARVCEQLLGELDSEAAAGVFTPLLRTRCCNALRKALRDAPTRPRVERRPMLFARALPGPLRAAVRQWRSNKPTLEPRALAFRAFLATRMHALLRADAATQPATFDRAISA